MLKINLAKLSKTLRGLEYRDNCNKLYNLEFSLALCKIKYSSRGENCDRIYFFSLSVTDNLGKEGTRRECNNFTPKIKHFPRDLAQEI